MKQWLVVVLFFGCGLLQTLCCCAVASTSQPCDTKPVLASCCNPHPQDQTGPALQGQCHCREHGATNGETVLLSEIKPASVISLASKHAVLFLWGGSAELPAVAAVEDTRGHGPPSKPARLCRFLI